MQHRRQLAVCRECLVYLAFDAEPQDYHHAKAIALGVVALTRHGGVLQAHMPAVELDGGHAVPCAICGPYTTGARVCTKYSAELKQAHRENPHGKQQQGFNF